LDLVGSGYNKMAVITPHVVHKTERLWETPWTKFIRYLRSK